MKNFYYKNLVVSGGADKSHASKFSDKEIKSRGKIISTTNLIIKRINKTPYFFYSMYRSLFIILGLMIISYININKQATNGLKLNQIKGSINLFLTNSNLYVLFTGGLAAIIGTITAVLDDYASF